MDLEASHQQNIGIRFFEHAQDNEAVLRFIERSPMRLGGIELLYDRRPDFSRLLECQSSVYRTLIGKQKERIIGMFSMSFQKKWIRGRKHSCAYIGDFRTDGSRSAARLWRKSYAEILKSMMSNESCGRPEYFLTAILKKNTEAIRNLTTTKKDLGFRYEGLGEIDMVNVYGRLPWCKPSTLKVVTAQTQDLPALKYFLNRFESQKNFGSIFDGSEDDCWTVRENSWNGFSIHKFLLIKNQAGEIQACTLPWDPGFAKRMLVRRAPVALRIAFRSLHLLGFKMPAVGDSLKTIYLTNFNYDPALSFNEVAKAFVGEVFTSHKDVHMISFADEGGSTKSIRGWIQQRISVLLYSVSVNSCNSFQANEKVAFEMGLV